MSILINIDKILNNFTLTYFFFCKYDLYKGIFNQRVNFEKKNII